MHRSVCRVVAVLAVTLCGCTHKQAASADTSAVAQAGANVPTPASRGSFDPATHTAVVHTSDFAFDAPDSISGGWTTFHLVNDGQTLHHIELVRLDSGKTAADLKVAMQNPGPPPQWAVFVGGPNAADPNGQVDDVVNLTPGNYLLMCLVDVPGGIPHFTKGMLRPLAVTPASETAASEPVADATITLADYAFTLSGALTPGAHIIKVMNSGPQLHEVEMVKLAPGKTPSDMLAWLANPNGPPPGSALGGVSPTSPGAPNYFKTDLTAGNYALICFVPDRKDGKPHFTHGMVKEIKVG